MIPMSIRATREIGVRQLIWFGWYRLAVRLGVYRWQCPAVSWDTRSLGFWLNSRTPPDPLEYLQNRASTGPDFFFSSGRSLSTPLQSLLGSEIKTVISEADALQEGTFQVFGKVPVRTENPPDWGGYLPLADQGSLRSETFDRHWSAYQLDALEGDVKLIWELARFAWVYPLVRAYALSGDDQYYQVFQQLFESWLLENPPNLGLHWHSAQEIAIRLMALVFAWYGFLDLADKDPKRFGRIAAVIATHADRIPATLSYARAQNNNHLLVEAVGLYTAGLLFPEFSRAERWRYLGEKWTIESLERQVFADGGYVQHSTNYHRMALEAGIWAARLAEVNGHPLPERSLEALRRMVRHIAAITDADTGQTPNFGPNDGAQLLPLSSCDYSDFRPTIQAANRLLDGRSCYPAGNWDELSVWLGLELQGGMSEWGYEGHFPQAGLYQLSGRTTRGVLRAARFTNRPGHSDQTHFDLWKGEWNILRDPGTYLYNGRPPWVNPFSPARFHNSLIIDDLEPMQHVGRFLWLDWSTASLLGHWRSESGEIEAIAIQHDAYEQMGILHTRMVIRAGDDRWTVIDKLLGSGEHEARISWNLDADSWELNGNEILIRRNGFSGRLEWHGPTLRSGVYSGGIFQAGEDIEPESELLGWYSSTYALKELGLTWVTRARVTLPAVLSTQVVLQEPARELSINWVDDETSLLPIVSAELDGEEVSFDHADIADPPGLHNNR